MAGKRTIDTTGAGRDAITPEKVLDTALAILERDGVAALSMRGLAAELGVGSPTVYWHIGNRDELLNQLIARITDELGRIKPTGSGPSERISSICRALLAEVRMRPQLIALSATQGRGEAIFIKAQEVIAHELTESGLHGGEAAFALSTILFHLGGFIMLEHALSPDFRLHGVEQWRGDDDDPDLGARLREGVDVDEIFEFTLDAVLASLLAGQPSDQP